MQLTNEQVGVEHVTKVFSQILRGSDVFTLIPLGSRGFPRLPCTCILLGTHGPSPAQLTLLQTQNLPTWVHTPPEMSVLGQLSVH